MQIKDIAEVTAGYAFRGAIEPDDNGDIYVFQAKNVSVHADFFNTSILTRISQDIPEYAGHLEKGDILLVARGMKSGAFRATVFVSDATNVVASSSLHIIRITSAAVLPEYVAHYLNSSSGQSSLAELISGSYIGALPRKELEQLKVPIPPLTKQKAIVNLQTNILKQQSILDRRNILNQNILNSIFRNLTTA